ncbi:MAG: hypothetical protein WCA19_17465 [Candidatus Acidiferrales bacterium]
MGAIDLKGSGSQQILDSEHAVPLLYVLSRHLECREPKFADLGCGVRFRDLPFTPDLVKAGPTQI